MPGALHKRAGGSRLTRGGGTIGKEGSGTTVKESVDPGDAELGVLASSSASNITLKPAPSTVTLGMQVLAKPQAPVHCQGRGAQRFRGAHQGTSMLPQ